MANWQNTIDISEPWEQVDQGELEIQKLALFVSESLEALSPYADEEVEAERHDLAEAFKQAALDEDLNCDSFNSLMFELYNWGDRSLGGNGKVCWIQTF